MEATGSLQLRNSSTFLKADEDEPALELHFTVNPMLRIETLRGNWKSASGHESYSFTNRPYYKILPRIKVGRKDALREVIEKGKRKFFEGYWLKLSKRLLAASILIEPIRKRKADRVTGASVEIYANPLSHMETPSQISNNSWGTDMGVMGAIIAHAIRAPMNSIKGAIYYLKKRYSDMPDLDEITVLAEEEISRIDDLVAKLLHTLSVNGGFSPTDIACILRGLQPWVNLQASARQIDCEYSYNKTLKVYGNAFQLEQAFLNVVNNAIEAMPRGGKLSIRTYSHSFAARNYAVFEIADSGKGMFKGLEDLVLQRRDREGRGFGLLITRSILHQHGGHLQIIGEESVGTRVRLLIPTCSKRGRHACTREWKDPNR